MCGSFFIVLLCSRITCVEYACVFTVHHTCLIPFVSNTSTNEMLLFVFSVFNSCILLFHLLIIWRHRDACDRALPALTFNTLNRISYALAAGCFVFSYPWYLCPEDPKQQEWKTSDNNVTKYVPCRACQRAYAYATDHGENAR